MPRVEREMHYLTSLSHMRRWQVATLMRWVVVRPLGGLNDTLCQISAAMRYASLHGRHLAIDTSRPGSGLRMSANHIFRVLGSHPIALEVPPSVAASASIFPSNVRSIGATPPAFHNGLIIRERTFALPKRNVPSEVVYTERGGGGQRHFEALRSLSLAPEVSEYVSTRVANLPEPGAALHVRGTDLQFSPKELEATLRRIPSRARPVYLATDSHDVLDYVTQRLGVENCFSLNAFRSRSSQPLHLNGLTKQQAHDALVDLFMLAKSPRLLGVSVSNNSVFLAQRFSGFYMLAMSLNRYRNLRSSFFVT